LCRVVGSFFTNALSAQLFTDDRVVHEFAQNGKRRFPGESLRLSDGIADPEADAKMFRNDDLHLLCATKFMGKSFYFLPAFTICSSTRRYSLKAARPFAVRA